MTKHSNEFAYPVKPNPVLTDKVTGFNSETNKKETVSYQFSDIQDLILAGLSPIVGGTLKITEIIYNGILTTPEAVANQLDPSVIIMPYEIVILNINNNKYQLKLQDLSIGLSETPILATDFITLSLVASNLAVGISTYKGINSSTKREEHYSIGSVGFNISKELDGLGAETGKILFEQIEQTNLGGGINIYKGFNNTSKKQEFNTIASSGSLKIRKEVVSGTDTGRVLIDLPNVGAIPSLFVNNSAIPSYDEWVFAGGNLISNPTFEYKGFGTESNPFTDTIRYLTETTYTITTDTSIANAVASYVGTGTRLLPQKSGQKIKVQENTNGGYNYAGDFSYMNLYLEYEENINCTTLGYIVDMDNTSYFNALNATLTLSQTKKGKYIQSNGLGFRNAGNSIATTSYTSGRQINILGDGISIYSSLNDITKYLINADETNLLGNNNDGGLAFYITGDIRADYQGIYKIGGKSKVDFLGELQSGTLTTNVALNLKAFVLNGGQVRHFGKAAYKFENLNTRTDLIQFNPTPSYQAFFYVNEVVFSGRCVNLFNKTTTENVTLQLNNSVSAYSLIITNIFETPITTPKWSPEFRDNNFATGNVDSSKIDLTAQNLRSSINTIGINIIESLRVYNSKEQARTQLLPMGSAFIKSNTFNAVDLVQGVEYKIITSGTPSLGTVGTYLIATGAETGTGIASLETREILS